MSTKALAEFPSENMESSATVKEGKKPKTVNIFVGFFFMVNFCLGTGFLGVPYSFFYSGYLAAIPTLLVVAVVTWLTGMWYVECMARAQALESFKQDHHSATNGITVKDTINKSPDLDIVNTPHTHEQTHPNFTITVTRCFEPVEMCQVFFGQWLRYIYIVILGIYCLFASWSFCTVAGSAWASNIPYNFAGIRECSEDAFHHELLPSDPGCLRAYYFSLFLFGIIVVTLSLLDLKEQAIVQLVMGLLRFFTVGAILVYSIAKLSEGDDVCVRASGNESDWYSSTLTWLDFDNATRYTSFKEIVVKFDVKGWLAATPVLTYAFIVHQGIPSLTHPIKQKKYLHWLMLAMFGTATVCYLSLGVVVPLWFKASTQETITLNFGDFTKSHPHHSPQLKVLAYYLIFFPSLDVMSAYPLMIHVIVNNMYSLVHDLILFLAKLLLKREVKQLRGEWIIKLIFRFVVALLPLLLALAMANLIYVLRFAGLFGFFMCFFFPAALQFQSIRVCRKTFGINSSSLSRKEPSFKQALSEDSPLIQKENSLKTDKKSYMTPYSHGVFSHPAVACVVGAIGVCLFVLTFSSWFVHPEKITCSLQ